jgi:competence ComEA-like helix-hairpin-helix protein
MAIYTDRQAALVLALVVAAGVALALGEWRRPYPETADLPERAHRTPAVIALPRPPPDSRELLPALRSGGRATAAEAPVDLNQASAADLTRVPGIGAVLADRIVAARDAGGRFASVDELRRVAGIGGARLARARPHVTVTP